MEGSSGPSPPADSTFKILITTDNHLGFLERHPIRGEDSFATFEEVLRAARVEHNVDCMLLGGDLFHDNKPTLGCLNRTCAMFRQYLWGNKPIEFTLRSDPEQNFPSHTMRVANWQDPNVNIAIPAFAIHGNHDDPVGGTSSLHLLANNGHLNYFGLVDSLENITVQPVLLQKGNTYVALYGLGNIRDDRLHRCFQLNKIHFIKPKQGTDARGLPIRWFSILLLHQNRGMRATRSKTGITEEMLAPFGFQLVIWGNEHEQRMVPEPTPYRYDIIQPGSTILTSITPQDCNPKQYGVLEIRGCSYRLTPFPLHTVRPIVRRTVELSHDRDHPPGRTLEEVEAFLHQIVAGMIDEAQTQVDSIPSEVKELHPRIVHPLMRLSVDFSDPGSVAFPKPNAVRFGQQYMGVVANPEDVLKEIKPSDKRSAAYRANILHRGALGRAADAVNGGSGSSGEVPLDGDAFLYANAIPQFRTVDIATKVAEVFRSGIRPPCQVLSEMQLSAAVYAFAEKNEGDAIGEKIEEMLNVAQRMAWHRIGSSDAILNEKCIAEELYRCKIEREARLFKGFLEPGKGKAVAPQPPSEGPQKQPEEEEEEEAPFSQDFEGVGGGQGREGAAMGDIEELLRAGGGGRDHHPGSDTNADLPPFIWEQIRLAQEQEQAERRNRQNANGAMAAMLAGEDDEDDPLGDVGGGRGGDDVLLGMELGDLPDDGLSRTDIDAFVANAIGGDDGKGGRKRGRAQQQHYQQQQGNMASPAFAVDVDDDDNGGSEDDGVEVSQMGPPRRGGGGGHVGQPTTTRRRAERKPRAKTATTTTAAHAPPALNLIPNSHANNDAAARASRMGKGGATTATTVQPLILAKWGGSSQSKS